MTVIAECIAPVPLVGKFAENILAMINRKDIVYFLNYLKLKFEVKRT